jgi:cytochrome c-type biogenesis protein CcmE
VRLAAIGPTRALVVAVLGAIALAVVMRQCEATPVALEAWGGIVERQTLERDVKGSYQFRLHVDWPEHGRRVVRYRGVLPDTVCEGAVVMVRGRLALDGHIEAAELLGIAASKYDPCARYFCHRETAPQQCQYDVFR